MSNDSKDFLVKYVPVISVLVLAVFGFAMVKFDSLNNRDNIADIESELKLIKDIDYRVTDNRNKNLMTYQNLESFKKSQSEKLDSILRSQHESSKIQSEMLGIMKMIGTVYPTKDKVRQLIAGVKEKINDDMKLKVDYNRINKIYLNKQ
jgi:hypothetical protein